MKKIEVYYDGCCEPKNPGGNAGFGAVIFQYNGREKKKIKEISKYWPEKETNSNNVAEYLGLISALEWLIEEGYDASEIIFYGDNMMSVRQMNGQWRAKKGMYLPLYEKAIKLKENFVDLKFEWIPREQNEIADKLSKEQLKKKGVELRIQPEGVECGIKCD